MWFLRLLERVGGPRPARTSYGLPVAAGALAVCLTILFLAMRRVMEIGGSCGSGGPYVIATPCPKGIGWMMPVSIIGGLVAALALALSAGHGPKLWLLAWPALFLSLGWNFLEYGLDKPAVMGEGRDPGFLTCAVLFLLMGGIPLIGVLRWGARSVFWGSPIDEVDPLRQEGLARQRTTVVVLAAVAVLVGLWLGVRIVDANV